MENGAAVVVRRVRTRKEDSAFLYAVLEAHEGIATFSTLPHEPSAGDRIVELVIPLSQLEEAERVLGTLGDILLAVE